MEKRKDRRASICRIRARRAIGLGASRRGTVERDCACRAAVMRAYDGMIASEAPVSVALDAARRVYRYHHPETAEEAASEIVEAWVFQGPRH